MKSLNKQPIKCIWAALSYDENGNEGIISAPGPVLCAEEDNVSRLKELMSVIEPAAKEHGMEMRLVKFDRVEELTWQESK